jgi:hypothetical protein
MSAWSVVIVVIAVIVLLLAVGGAIVGRRLSSRVARLRVRMDGAAAALERAKAADAKLGFDLTYEEQARAAPPQPTQEERASHLVRIYDTRPFRNDPDRYDPYFVAICACDWTGTPEATEAAAIRDGHAHSSNVAPGLVRPVG